jgi:hypothetical protein
MKEGLAKVGRFVKVQLHFVEAFQRVTVTHPSGLLGKYFETGTSSEELVALVGRTVDL